MKARSKQYFNGQYAYFNSYTALYQLSSTEAKRKRKRKPCLPSGEEVRLADLTKCYQKHLSLEKMIIQTLNDKVTRGCEDAYNLVPRKLQNISLWDALCTIGGFIWSRWDIGRCVQIVGSHDWYLEGEGGYIVVLSLIVLCPTKTEEMCTVKDALSQRPA